MNIQPYIQPYIEEADKWLWHSQVLGGLILMFVLALLWDRSLNEKKKIRRWLAKNYPKNI